MGKDLQGMRKSNLIGYGCCVASLLLSGALLVSKEKEIESLDHSLFQAENTITQYKELLLLSEARTEGYKEINNELIEENKEIKELSNILNEKYKAEKASKERLAEELKIVKKRIDKSQHKEMKVEITAYTAKCKGCSGFTFTEYDVRNTTTYNGLRVIASDNSVIPLYSIVEIKTKSETFKAIVLDRGGAIKGNKIDLLVRNKKEAMNFGRQAGSITVLRSGKGAEDI